MKKNSSEHEPTLGFVTITDDQSVGYIGGYLLLNSRARPLEFHCTAPVQPSRAQEILYGAILKSYLYGEQIAGALLARAKIVPDLLISDIAEIAEARPLEGVPTFLLTATPSTADEGGTQIRVHGACDGTADSATMPQGPKWLSFSLGGHRLALPARFAHEQQVAEQFWHTWGDGMALDEPFVRIREAVNEAQRPAKTA